MFKCYVNIYCTYLFFTNALCAFGEKANSLPFFGKGVWCAQNMRILITASVPLMYIVCSNLIELATHIQAHSKPCREVRTEMLRCMSTSAGRSYAHGTYYMQVELSSPYQARDFLDDTIMSGTKPQ